MKSFSRISIGFIFLFLIVAHVLLVSLLLCPAPIVLAMAAGHKIDYVDLKNIPQHVQQLFPEKDISKDLTISDGSLVQKIAAKVLGVRHDKFFDKNDLLEYRLNTLDFGGDVIGIESASEYYFNKPVSELSFEEALNLAGIYQVFLKR